MIKFAKCSKYFSLIIFSIIVQLISFSNRLFSQVSFENLYTNSFILDNTFEDQLIIRDSIYVAAHNHNDGACDSKGDILYFGSNGTPVGALNIGMPSTNVIHKLEKSFGDTYFVTGSAQLCSDSELVYIKKIDYANGTIWQKKYTYFNLPLSNLNCLSSLDDSGCIFSFESYPNDINLIRFDKWGNVLFHKKYHGFKTPNSLIYNKNGKLYYLVSIIDSLNQTNLSVITFNNQGDSLNTFPINKSYLFAINKMIGTADSNLVFLGWYKDSNNVALRTIVKLDTIGNMIWKKTLKGFPFRYDVNITESNTGDLITCSMYKPSSTLIPMLTRYSSLGDSIIGINFPNFFSATILSANVTADNSFWGVGKTTFGGNVAYYVKTFPMGNSTSDHSIESLPLNINVSPNPAKDFIQINSSKPVHDITLFNYRASILLNKSSSDNLLLPQLADGMYFLNIKFLDGSFVIKKLIIQNH